MHRNCRSMKIAVNRSFAECKIHDTMEKEQYMSTCEEKNGTCVALPSFMLNAIIRQQWFIQMHLYQDSLLRKPYHSTTTLKMQKSVNPIPKVQKELFLDLSSFSL